MENSDLILYLIYWYIDYDWLSNDIIELVIVLINWNNNIELLIRLVLSQ